MTAALVEVDRAIGYLVDQLERRGIDGHVNLVIVSDHGMEDSRSTNYIYLEDAKVELENCFSFELGAIAFLRPRDAHSKQEPLGPCYISALCMFALP